MLRNDYGKNSPEGGTKQSGNAGANPEPAAENGEPVRFVAPSHGGIDILKLLNELEEIVDSTPRVMGAMIRFDEDRFHMTLMKIRANLPEEMKRASKLVRDSERIVAETQEVSEKMITDSRSRAQLELDRAKKDATTLLDQAQRELKQEREAFQREMELKTEEGKAAAEAIIREARDEAARMVSDNSIVIAAEAAAEDIRRRAEDEATNICDGANQYAASVLANLAHALSRATNEVERGREVLESHSQG